MKRYIIDESKKNPTIFKVEEFKSTHELIIEMNKRIIKSFSHPGKDLIVATGIAFITMAILLIVRHYA